LKYVVTLPYYDFKDVYPDDTKQNIFRVRYEKTSIDLKDTNNLIKRKQVTAELPYKMIGSRGYHLKIRKETFLIKKPLFSSQKYDLEYYFSVSSIDNLFDIFLNEPTNTVPMVAVLFDHDITEEVTKIQFTGIEDVLIAFGGTFSGIFSVCTLINTILMKIKFQSELINSIYDLHTDEIGNFTIIGNIENTDEQLDFFDELVDENFNTQSIVDGSQVLYNKEEIELFKEYGVFQNKLVFNISKFMMKLSRNNSKELEILSDKNIKIPRSYSTYNTMLKSLTPQLPSKIIDGSTPIYSISDYIQYLFASPKKS
jgi:hypothetical protein